MIREKKCGCKIILKCSGGYSHLEYFKHFSYCDYHKDNCPRDEMLQMFATMREVQKQREKKNEQD